MEANFIIRLQDRFSSPLSRIEGNMNRFESRVNSTQGFINSMGSSLVGAFTGGAVVGGVTSLISKVKELSFEAVNVTREFTNMKDAIEFASGDRADQNLQFLDNTINRLGLDMQSTYKGFKTFQGALMGTSLEGQKGLDVFEAVSEAASVMKLSAEGTEGSFLALGQMISKGNVSAEELRTQLGERLPGAFQIFARALGVSTSKLDDMLRKGDVLAVDALPKVAAELKKTFGPGVAKAQESFTANWNRFNNFILQTKLSIGNGLIPTINELITIIPRLDFTPILFTFQQVGAEISNLMNQFNGLLNMFGASFSTFDKLTFFLRYIAYLIRVAWTPIRVLIEVYTQFVQLVKNSFGILQGLGNILAGLWNNDFDRMNKGVDQLRMGIVSLGRDAGKSFSKFWDAEKEGWGKLFSPFGDNKGSSFASGSGSGSSKSSSASGSGGSTGKAAGVEKIASGTRNIILNISQLVGEIKFEKSVERSEAQMMDIVKRVLLTAVNDVNIVAQ